MASQQSLWDQRYSQGHLSAGGQADPWLDTYLPRLGQKAGGRALDLGCGRGYNARRLSDAGYRVTACDFSPVALDLLHQHAPSIDVHCVDMAEHWPSGIGSMDLVLASLSTHYFSWEKTVELYQNIYHTLVPGGIFLFRVNSRDELRHKDLPLVVRDLEKDYYLLADGCQKRYFDTACLAQLLWPFHIEELRAASSSYHGHTKHYIEGLAVKPAALP